MNLTFQVIFVSYGITCMEIGDVDVHIQLNSTSYAFL